MKSTLYMQGKNGVMGSVTQTSGLGIREHDDVMLSYGYSKYTKLEKTLGANESMVMKITVPENIAHHAESRLVITNNESVRIRVSS